MKKALLAWAVVCASPCVATAQIAILHIRVTEGDGAVHRAGSRAVRPLTVEVTDETGRPQPDTAVSFHLPEDGPGGICGNGLRTDVVMTDAQGRASLKTLQLNRVSGPFRIRIIAAKEQARAGILSLQYIADPKGAAAATSTATAPAPAPAKSLQRRSRKWLVVALVAAGVVAGGIGARSSAGKSAGSAASASAPAQVSVGVPTISLGKP